MHEYNIGIVPKTLKHRIQLWPLNVGFHLHVFSITTPLIVDFILSNQNQLSLPSCSTSVKPSQFSPLIWAFPLQHQISTRHLHHKTNLPMWSQSQYLPLHGHGHHHVDHHGHGHPYAQNHQSPMALYFLLGAVQPLLRALYPFQSPNLSS